MPNDGARKQPIDVGPSAGHDARVAAISAAARAIADGGLVAFPTETVYGLGADATNSLAVARIFEAKGRPRFNPLIVHIPTLEMAERFGVFSDTARRLAAAFWPGPLTLVVPRTPDCPASDLVSAGLSTIALRIPLHDTAQALLRACGRPLAAPSANRSGHVSATTAEHVAADIGAKVAMILDAGPTPYGLESTVLFVEGNRVALLRPGAITAKTVEDVLGEKIERAVVDASAPQSPGQLESHYAPDARLRLDASGVHAGEALLAFGPAVPSTSGPVLNLSARGDLVEAAANLFAHLRTLDAQGCAAIAVMPIPHDGLGEAINDRLARAAAPRG